MSKVKLSKGSVFERKEEKYLLTPTQYIKLLNYLQDSMQIDQYGLHTISTIYYDNDDYSIVRHSLDHPDFKEKIRLRSYGTANKDTTVFLELKKKSGGITYKRRISLPLNEAEQYLSRKKPLQQNGQIVEEIDWFVSRQTSLAPRVVLIYERIALFDKEDTGFRITFDSNIRWRDYQCSLSYGEHGQLLLKPETRLMEIKILSALPLHLSKKFSELGIYAVSFSKYGTVYREYLQYKKTKYQEELKYVG